jgi:hypothetical protein
MFTDYENRVVQLDNDALSALYEITCDETVAAFEAIAAGATSENEDDLTAEQYPIREFYVACLVQRDMSFADALSIPPDDALLFDDVADLIVLEHARRIAED